MVAVNLPFVHARGHATPYRSFEEFWGRRRPEQGPHGTTTEIVAGGRSFAALRTTRESLIHVDDHAATYLAFEDFWGQHRQIAQPGLADRRVELVERQV